MCIRDRYNINIQTFVLICGVIMERVVLHSDLNNFYASVECLYNPKLRGKPVAVVGDPEVRHGIVLAKTYEAKAYGVQTGNPLWMAKQMCPDIIFVEPHYDLYLKYSNMAKKIYSEYTDQVEPYGIDECWLDVTGSTHLFGDGKTIADKIRKQIKSELGITVSVGVSYNKIFADVYKRQVKGYVPTINGDRYDVVATVTVVEKEEVTDLPVKQIKDLSLIHI